MNAIFKKLLRYIFGLLLILGFLVGTIVFVAMNVPQVGIRIVDWTHGTSFESLVALFLSDEHTDDHATEDSHDDEHSHADEHSHDESGSKTNPSSNLHQDQLNEIVISPVAAKNIGIDDTKIAQVKVVDYYKSLVIPAVVVERPGKSTITVPSPVSGVVAKIYFEQGVSVRPGEPLFEILLNQQEMVKGQTEYISLMKKREINMSEMQRLNSIDPQMVPKQRRELEFQQSEITLGLQLLRNTLLLQGLTAEDIDISLQEKGEIVQKMVIMAPPMIDEPHDLIAEVGTDHTYTIENLFVTPGKNVAIGESLCQLSDLCEVSIRGKIFANNSQQIKKALNSRSRVSSVFSGAEGEREIIEGLRLRSLENYVNPESGTLYCYADLKNNAQTYEMDDRSPEQSRRHYTNWHFKPGQRCELQIEYETLKNCIVLPVDAVAYDINDTCVFELVGTENDQKIWRKKPVHVIYSTRDVVVIANDDAISPGASIATKGASFLLAALYSANQKGAGGGAVQHGDHVH
ncbi:MAG: efflux RND transporter periplasmic adaptor subunit [Thermoguttaceae bacterium]